MQKLETEVLIVGGGPTGLLASILLSKLGIRHMLIDQKPSTVEAPAAHVISARTLEIYHQAGLDTQELYALNRHPLAHQVTWKTTLDGKSIGVFDMRRANPDIGDKASRQHTTNISQHLLEQKLREAAVAGAYASIQFSTEWQAFKDENLKTSRIQNANGEQEITYQYLIAADGAASPISKSLGVKKTGPDAIATFLNLTCEVDLSQISGEANSLLYWLLDPDVMGTLIVHDPKDLCVYMRPIAVPFENPQEFDEEKCTALANQVFGNAPHSIKHRGVWKMTAQVADQFRVGPVFFAGDSAHRFPPTGGLGLNTGAADVHNLVWKIAAVLKKELSDETINELLESYEQERKPIATRNSEISQINNEKMTEVIEAIGLDPSKAHLLAKTMNSRFARILPNSLREGLHALLTKPVRRLLNTALDEHRGEKVQKKIREAIQNQHQHFNSIGLDLGYAYQRSPALDPNDKQAESNPVTSYTESTWVGARFPERQLSNFSKPSLHDCIEYGAFTQFGVREIDAHQRTFGLPINKVDLAHVKTDSDQLVSDSLGLNDKDWVLVRPDGHVMNCS